MFVWNLHNENKNESQIVLVSWKSSASQSLTLAGEGANPKGRTENLLDLFDQFFLTTTRK